MTILTPNIPITILLFMLGYTFNGEYIIKYLRDKNCTFNSYEMMMISSGHLCYGTGIIIAITPIMNI